MYKKIRCNKTLYNGGVCFTKGFFYDLPYPIANQHQLMNVQLINDMGEPHIISTWYKHFTLT